MEVNQLQTDPYIELLRLYSFFWDVNAKSPHLHPTNHHLLTSKGEGHTKMLLKIIYKSYPNILNPCSSQVGK
jgi:hypothetical protein